MSNQIAIISDIHFGVRNDLPVLLNFHKKFFDQVFFPKIDELGIKTVVNLGDTFDRRKYTNHNTLFKAKEMFFDELKHRDIWSPTIVGNHDTFHKNTNQVNTIELMCNEFHYPNLKVINSPQVLDIQGFPILMVPWICDDNYLDCFKLIDSAATDLCMGHFAINGFVMHVGQVSEEGLDRAIFDKYDMVFSGHFHHRSSDGRIFYLGNPCEMTWQDYNDTKGFHIFDLETRRLTFIPNPYRLFYRIIYDDSEYDYRNYGDLSYLNQTYVKVVVEKKTKPKMYEEFMESLYAVDPHHMQSVQNYADVVEFEGFNADQADDTLTMIKKFVNAKTEMDEYADMTKDLHGLIEEIYAEAINMEN